MFESTRVRNRVLTPYFILPLGQATFSVEKEQVKVNAQNKVIVDEQKKPVIETVTVKETLNWGCLFLKRDCNVAYFLSSQDELKLLAVDNLPFYNVLNGESRKLDTVPFVIVDKLSQFLTEQDSVINHCNLSTLVKSGFISYEFQKNNIVEILNDYCRLNAIESIDDKTLDTIISRDNAQRMGIIHTQMQLHDQLKPLLLQNSNETERIDLSTENKAVTVDAIASGIDYLNTSPRVNAENTQTLKDETDLKSFDQGVTSDNLDAKISVSTPSTNGKKAVVSTAN